MMQLKVYTNTIVMRQNKYTNLHHTFTVSNRNKHTKKNMMVANMQAAVSQPKPMFMFLSHFSNSLIQTHART